MATTTDNIQLVMPDLDERFNVQDWNGNMEIIDRHIGDVEELAERVRDKIDKPINQPEAQFLQTNSMGAAFWGPAPSQDNVARDVAQWLTDHVNPQSQVVIDDTLMVSGAAADAGQVGVEIGMFDDMLDTEAIVSKNVNRTPYASSYSSYGVTLRCNPDNSVRVYGTPTDWVRYPSIDDTSFRWILNAGTYTLSGGVDALMTATLFLFASKTDTTPAASYTCGVNDAAPVSFTIGSSMWAFVRLEINPLIHTTDGKIFKPQIQRGTTASAYVSPWGSKKSNRLDEIEENVAQNTSDVAGAVRYDQSQTMTYQQQRLARNNIGAAKAEDTNELFLELDIRSEPTKNLNVTPFPQTYNGNGAKISTQPNNSLKLAGTPTAWVWWPDVNDFSLRWRLPAGTYTLSGGINAYITISVMLYANQTDTTAVNSYICGPNNGAPVVFTTASDYWAMVRVAINPDVGTITGNVIYPQIERGTVATSYVSPWSSHLTSYKLDELDEAMDGLVTNMTTIRSEMDVVNRIVLNKGARRFRRQGQIIQYTPDTSQPVTIRIDFETTSGTNKIVFTHCGENLLDLAGVIEDGTTYTGDGLTGIKNGGYIYTYGTNQLVGYNTVMMGYMSSYNYWLPPGLYATSECYGISCKNKAGTVYNKSRVLQLTEPVQATQWYFSIMGGHTVDYYYPAGIVTGDVRPKEYKPFVGERIIINLPVTAYGGWIDVNNFVLHVTKTLSGGVLVDTTDTTYNIDPFTLSEITETNTLYTVDGVITASGFEIINPIQEYEDPVPDWYLNNLYFYNKTERIKSLAQSVAGNGDVFFFITDVHTEKNNLGSVPMIRELYRSVGIPRLFCGGDIGDGYDDQNIYYIPHFVRYLKQNYPGEIHITMGNHEYFSTPESKLAQLFDLGKSEQIGNPERHYYYVNNYQQKIRYIILASCKPSTGAGMSWAMGYEQEQLDWLAQEALNVETGWSIILFTHVTYDMDYTTGQITHTPDETQSMLNVLDAYNGNGEIIALFGGHMHCDAVWHTDGGIPIILTTCDKSQPYLSPNHSADFNSSIRTINTINEQAFDVVIVDKTNRQIRMVRIGCPAWNLVDGYIDRSNEYLEERVINY